MHKILSEIVCFGGSKWRRFGRSGRTKKEPWWPATKLPILWWSWKHCRPRRLSRHFQTKWPKTWGRLIHTRPTHHCRMRVALRSARRRQLSKYSLQPFHQTSRSWILSFTVSTLASLFLICVFVSCVSNTASLPRLPADDNFDRPASPRVRLQELAQVWAIAHLLLLDHVCGTTYLSIYMTLNIHSWSSAGYWRRTCFAEDSGAQWLVASWALAFTY